MDGCLNVGNDKLFLLAKKIRRAVLNEKFTLYFSNDFYFC